MRPLPQLLYSGLQTGDRDAAPSLVTDATSETRQRLVARHGDAYRGHCRRVRVCRSEPPHARVLEDLPHQSRCLAAAMERPIRQLTASARFDCEGPSTSVSGGNQVDALIVAPEASSKGTDRPKREPNRQDPRATRVYIALVTTGRHTTPEGRHVWRCSRRPMAPRFSTRTGARVSRSSFTMAGP